MVYQNHKSRSFEIRRGVSRGSVLAPVLFSPSMIFLLPCLLPSAALCADDLTVWPSLPSAELMVLQAAPAVIRSASALFVSFCAVPPRIPYTARFSATPFTYATSGKALENCPVGPHCGGGHTSSFVSIGALV